MERKPRHVTPRLGDLYRLLGLEAKSLGCQHVWFLNFQAGVYPLEPPPKYASHTLGAANCRHALAEEVFHRGRLSGVCHTLVLHPILERHLE